MKVEFKYSAIKTDQYAIFDCPAGFSPQDCHISGEVQTANNYDAKSIMVKVIANIKFKGQLILTLAVSSYFEIEDESWMSMTEGGFVTVPKEIIWHLGGLAISTTRGILFSKTESTDLNRIILPVININDIITADMKIPIPDQPKTI